MAEMDVITENLPTDFATLFGYLWYRDFPVDARWRMSTACRSDWTLHIASTIRAAAHIMGLYLHCEEGGRTDGTLKTNRGEMIAPLEWEWNKPAQSNWNELDKLIKRSSLGRFAGLVCYVPSHETRGVLDDFARRWHKSAEGPLVVFLIVFDQSQGARSFDRLDTYLLDRNEERLLRSRPALPWQVKGSRWEAGEASTSD